MLIILMLDCIIDDGITEHHSADVNIVVQKIVLLPYDGDAAMMMVLLEQWRLSLLPLIMLMMTIASNYLQW